MQIEGYTIYSNNLQDTGRGIVNYVRHDIICQQIYLDNSFNEYLLLQLQLKNKSKVLILVQYIDLQTVFQIMILSYLALSITLVCLVTSTNSY